MRKVTTYFIIIAIGLILLNSTFYIIKEGEQAIVVEFGKPVSETITDAGLHYKVPFTQDAIKFEKRILEWDGSANEIPTKDNKYIFIDAFARWQIKDALKFYKAAKNEMMAQSRLDDIIDGAVRDEISNRTMEEIIRSSNRPMIIADASTIDETMMSDSQSNTLISHGARLDIIADILKAVHEKFAEIDMGIEVIDIMLKRIDYNEEVRTKLFDRMISEQSRIAEKYRAQGQGEKQKIMGMTTQRKKEIMSEAYQKAQKIKGKADAEAVKIYANAYSKSPDFYRYIKTLETYHQTIGKNSTLILSTDNQYLRFLGN